MATGKDKRKKRRPRDNPAQSRKFIEAAKRLGVDTNGKAFEEAMRNLLKGKRGNN
jgi:hypothetical protein